jgi:dGTPase
MKENLKYSPLAKRYLAAYASCPEGSKGRLYKEESNSLRSCYQKDRDRIINSESFRRLKYKTQVFVNYEGDHFRTRLTHSLEVSQIARSVARVLDLDEDLTEGIALAHDLGHSPFGHAGEDALKEVMKKYGGFNHNAQTIAILTKLERKYASFKGLNLTWETLEGLAKHNGPVLKAIPRALNQANAEFDLELKTFPSLEAQIASLSDDIAYISHDIQDGIRANLIGLHDLDHLPIVGDIIRDKIKLFKTATDDQIIHETKRELIGVFVDDLIKSTNLQLSKIKSVKDIRNAKNFTATFSKDYSKNILTIKEFLFKNMYHHYKVKIMVNKLKQVLIDLFEYFLKHPDTLPPAWQAEINKKNLAIVVSDYISGMTDRYALSEHKKIFDYYSKLIGV